MFTPTPIQKKILTYLAKHPNATHREVGDKLDVCHSTIQYHIKKLILAGLIFPAPQKRWNVAN